MAAKGLTHEMENGLNGSYSHAFPVLKLFVATRYSSSKYMVFFRMEGQSDSISVVDQNKSGQDSR